MAEQRRVVLKGNVSKLAEGGMFGFGIYVRDGLPLPEVGEEIEASMVGAKVVYSGRVIGVDRERRTYDVRLHRKVKKVRSLE